MLSFVLFPKPFNVGYVLGAGIMLSGVGMNVALKNEALAARVWAVCRGSGGEGSALPPGHEVELDQFEREGSGNRDNISVRRRIEPTNFIV